ncbi:hypothetical protein PIB30_051181 [Stylosanthes scabra]|uniref:Uncharacterized protein n=1 Tax=Stylosanthes scabra TaxID=79078 RepID=A0ABU6VHH8_9FABA|nr:hypothetical protein [Stylosanthes scabra]
MRRPHVFAEEERGGEERDLKERKRGGEVKAEVEATVAVVTVKPEGCLPLPILLYSTIALAPLCYYYFPHLSLRRFRYGGEELLEEVLGVALPCMG